jgi:hypothetical protein
MFGKSYLFMMNLSFHHYVIMTIVFNKILTALNMILIDFIV